MTDAEVKASLSEFHAYALTLWGEARSEPIEGIIAVGNVIRNRKLASVGNYRDVIFKRWQFSCWESVGGQSNYDAVMKLARALVADHAIASATVKDKAFIECAWIAEGLIGNRLRDNTEKSNHYLTSELFHTNPPKWAKNQIPTAVVGNHVFLKL